MDKDPRVISERDRIRSLTWVQEARRGYTRAVDEGKTQTDFLRGRPFLDLIDKSSQADLSHLSQGRSVLIVGLGMDTGSLDCSYEAQKINAHLHLRGSINDQLTLVDLSSDVIGDIRTRQTLFVTPMGDNIERQQVANEWEKYLTDTGQNGRVIYAPEAGLNIYGPSETQEMYLERGIWAADVTQEFHTSIATGRIRILEDDIALADLRGSRPFDFVEMTNVFWILTPQGQQLALANIAGHMNKNGLIFMNDLDAGPPVLSHREGWLTDEKLKDLRLAKGEVLFRDQSKEWLSLIKK